MGHFYLSKNDQCPASSALALPPNLQISNGEHDMHDNPLQHFGCFANFPENKPRTCLLPNFWQTCEGIPRSVGRATWVFRNEGSHTMRKPNRTPRKRRYRKREKDKRKLWKFSYCWNFSTQCENVPTANPQLTDATNRNLHDVYDHISEKPATAETGCNWLIVALPHKNT